MRLHDAMQADNRVHDVLENSAIKVVVMMDEVMIESWEERRGCAYSDDR